MLQGALGTILAQNLQLNKLSIILGDVAKGVRHDVGTKNAIENFSTIIDVGSGAGHDIGAR